MLKRSAQDCFSLSRARIPVLCTDARMSRKKGTSRATARSLRAPDLAATIGNRSYVAPRHRCRARHYYIPVRHGICVFRTAQFLRCFMFQTLAVTDAWRSVPRSRGTGVQTWRRAGTHKSRRARERVCAAWRRTGMHGGRRRLLKYAFFSELPSLFDSTLTALTTCGGVGSWSQVRGRIFSRGS